jgi:hypothetical protein
VKARHFEGINNMKIEIKCRFSGSLLFEHDAEENTLKLTVEAAIKAGANLAGAYLAGANLAGANLAGAYLAGAYLDGANLDGAYLDGANLDGANLARANLAGANLARANLARANLAGAYLDGAYLAGAYLDGANLARANLAGANLAGANLAGAYLDGEEKLIGERPIFQLGPIGSRCAYFVAYITNKGLRLTAGCKKQISRERFETLLAETHGDDNHAQEYHAALAMIDAHAAIWTPKESEE